MNLPLIPPDSPNETEKNSRPGKAPPRIQVEFAGDGIFLPELDLWLDPRQTKPAAWLSHAHSDHATGTHSHVIGSPDTLTLYGMRWGGPTTSRVFQPLGFREALKWREAALTAFPAGHILGSAQLLVEQSGERLVYTGDIKLRAPLCGRSTEIVPCDRLILESTFGLPIYHFLSREEARDRIVSFAQRCFREGAVPVFLGYPLGRGQEVAHVLCEAGLSVAIHGAIARYIPVYEQAGYRFEGWRPYESGVEGKGDCALVVVPSMRSHFEALAGDCRIAYVSGWAALANARARSGASELIAYSDHADFEELLEIVDESGAQRVDLVHGYTEPLAAILRGRGVDAHAVTVSAQREEETDA